MNRMCRLGEAEQIISEMEERLIDVADDIAETEEDTQLVVSGWWVFLPQLNLQLHEGIYVTGMKRSRCSCRMWQ